VNGLRFPHPLGWYLQLVVDEHGSLRAAGKHLGISASYLLRLMRGDKKNPSDKLLDKLGLSATPYWIRK
jgi:hypothetical protein